MNNTTRLIYVVAIVSMLGAFATSAIAARTFWEELGDTSPRSIFDDLRDTAPVQAPEKGFAGE